LLAAFQACPKGKKLSFRRDALHSKPGLAPTTMGLGHPV